MIITKFFLRSSLYPGGFCILFPSIWLYASLDSDSCRMRWRGILRCPRDKNTHGLLLLTSKISCPEGGDISLSNGEAEWQFPPSLPLYLTHPHSASVTLLFYSYTKTPQTTFKRFYLKSYGFLRVLFFMVIVAD